MWAGFELYSDKMASLSSGCEVVRWCEPAPKGSREGVSCERRGEGRGRQSSASPLVCYSRVSVRCHWQLDTARAQSSVRACQLCLLKDTHSQQRLPRPMPAPVAILASCSAQQTRCATTAVVGLAYCPHKGQGDITLQPKPNRLSQHPIVWYSAPISMPTSWHMSIQMTGCDTHH